MAAKSVELVRESGTDLRMADLVLDLVDLDEDKGTLGRIRFSQEAFFEREEVTIVPPDLHVHAPAEESEESAHERDEQNERGNEGHEKPAQHAREPERQVAEEEALARLVESGRVVADVDGVLLGVRKLAALLIDAGTGV